MKALRRILTILGMLVLGRVTLLTGLSFSSVRRSVAQTTGTRQVLGQAGRVIALVSGDAPRLKSVQKPIELSGHDLDETLRD